MLPPRRAGAHPAERRALAGLQLPDRNGDPLPARRPARSGASDLLPRARRRHLQDDADNCPRSAVAHLAAPVPGPLSRTVQILIGAAFSLVCLVLAVRGLALERVAHALGQAQYALLVPALALYFS